MLAQKQFQNWATYNPVVSSHSKHFKWYQSTSRKCVELSHEAKYYMELSIMPHKDLVGGQVFNSW